MELWIRSQNRHDLLKISKFFLKEVTFEKNDSIWGEIYCNDDISVGLYKKERALEVLDEIQENIEKQGQVIVLTNERGIPNDSKFFGYVYEMPKE